MSRSLRTKQELLEEQQAENDRLLLTLMPEAVAKRYRQGEETISEDHQDVSVVFADIVGFDALSAQLPSEQSLALLNELVRSFDEAAGRLGVEKIRTLRTGYLASVGLTVPRVDNSRRAVDFAIEMDGIVQRFNGLHGTDAVAPGRGRHRHGDQRSGRPVHRRLRHVGRRGQSRQPGAERRRAVRASSSPAGSTTRCGTCCGFSPAGDIETKSGVQPVWRVETDGS